MNETTSPGLRRLLAVPLLLLLALAPACTKDSAPPSPEYAKAREQWLDLLKERMDKAYADPRADQVVLLLTAVDAKSMDYESAQALLKDIQKGRAEAAADKARLERELETARAATQPSPTKDFVPAGDAGSGATEGPAAAEEAKAPKAGMSEADFLSRFGDCFEARNEATVGGQLGGTAYGLKDLMKCREQLPGFQTKVVLVLSGKVDAVANADEVTKTKYKVVDGKLVPATEADLKPKPPPPAPAPEPAPEGPPTPGPEVKVVPGSPNAVPSTTLPVTNQP